MEYGVIGEHLQHSFSREIHKELADYTYAVQEIAPDRLAAFMTAAPFRGINVTIPYKRDVIPFLHSLDTPAQQIGAVNTVVNRDGKLYGYNTDFFGMTALIHRTGLELASKKVLIFGTGGTSRTAVQVAQALGAGTILRVSRHPEEKDEISYEQARSDHRDASFLINTTPVGMYPHPEGVPTSVTEFPLLEGVIDAVYNPLRTNLVLDAQQHGIPAAGGLFMLVAQAAEASRYFLGSDQPLKKIEKVFCKLMEQKENIVLIGMPGCGKTTIGGVLTSLTGRPLIDTDVCIAEKTGKDIPTIFSEEGENGFRDIEQQVIREQSMRTGVILATGGGAVLKSENIRALRQNGKIYFLNRPLDDLIPTSDRPLSSNREALEQRHRERYPLYHQTADVYIPVKDPQQAAAAILKDRGL